MKTIRVIFFILLSATTALSQTKPDPKQMTDDVKQFMTQWELREERRKVLQQEVKENPNSAEAHYKLGKAYLEGLPDAKKALEEFHHAINLKPDYPKTFVEVVTYDVLLVRICHSRFFSVSPF